MTQTLTYLSGRVSAHSVMAERGREEFSYRRVELLKAEPLGSGSYGGVCKAECDGGLVCAAKILHPTLFDLKDPGASSYLSNFWRECRLLSSVRHPNVVQYLAVCRDPDTRLPVLLMELCEGNLSAFLERSPGPLSYHVQVDICRDIALALVYLHSNGLIHRDLTGNNVLMVAGPRAKITDFGMSKLASVNPRMTAMTTCPGNMLFMAPEALDNTKGYTTKLDIFSLGVIAVQVITREFPDPTQRLLPVTVPQFCEPLLQVVPEVERRKAQLSLITDTHPLKPLALDCLGQKEQQRPSALELTERLSELKQSSQYLESVNQSRGKMHQLEQQLQEQRVLTESKSKEAGQYQAEAKQLKVTVNRLERELKEKLAISQRPNRHCEAGQDLTEESKEGEAVKTLEQQWQPRYDANTSLGLEREIQQLPQQRKHERSETNSNAEKESAPAERGISGMRWTEEKRAPVRICRGSAVVDGDTAYFRPASSQKVYSYKKSLVKWSWLPANPHESFSLAVVDGLLTSVGGWSGVFTGSLLSLSGEGENREWVEVFPAMPTPRRSPTCFSTSEALVAIGGSAAKGDLDTAEVMNIHTKQWSKCCQPLPQKCSQFSGTLHDNLLYLAGGYQLGSSTRSTYTCSLPDLLPRSNNTLSRLKQHFSPQSVWKEIRSLPVAHSTLVSFRGELLAIGGEIELQTPTNRVYRYDSLTDSWSDVESAGESKRSWCFAVVFSGDQLMVVGGCSEGSLALDNVDILQ